MIPQSDALNKVSTNELINSPAMCKLNKRKGKMRNAKGHQNGDIIPTTCVVFEFM